MPGPEPHENPEATIYDLKQKEELIELKGFIKQIQKTMDWESHKDCRNHIQDLELQLVERGHDRREWISANDKLKEKVSDLERQLRLAHGEIDLEKSEVAHRERQLAEARKSCTCDDPGDGRCPRHWRECELQDTVARLRDALEKYGQHGERCQTRWGKDECDCNCGFKEALAGDGGKELSPEMQSIGPVGGIGDGRPNVGPDTYPPIRVQRKGDGGKEK